MPVQNFYTVDEQIIGYSVTSRVDVLTDNLGSVTAEIDDTAQTRLYNARYKPYGGVLWETGVQGSFGWVGTEGYLNLGTNSEILYVRARHYSPQDGIWTTIDPLWPSQPAYLYVNGRPTRDVDPSGMIVAKITCDSHKDRKGKSSFCGKKFKRLFATDHFLDPRFQDPDIEDGGWASSCNGSYKNGLCVVYTLGQTGSWRALYKNCNESRLCPKECQNKQGTKTGVCKIKWQTLGNSEDLLKGTSRVLCGSLVKACVTRKGITACVTVTIIDQGPRGDLNAIMDLHVKPMNTMLTALGLPTVDDDGCRFGKFPELKGEVTVFSSPVGCC